MADDMPETLTSKQIAVTRVQIFKFRKIKGLYVWGDMTNASVLSEQKLPLIIHLSSRHSDTTFEDLVLK